MRQAGKGISERVKKGTAKAEKRRKGKGRERQGRGRELGLDLHR